MRENDLVNCVACSHRIGYLAPRCPQCGQIQPPPGQNFSSVEYDPKRRSVVILGVVGIVLMIGGALYMLGGFMKIIASFKLGYGFAPGTFMTGVLVAVAGFWCYRSASKQSR